MSLMQLRNLKVTAGRSIFSDVRVGGSEPERITTSGVREIAERYGQSTAAKKLGCGFELTTL